MNIPSKIMLNCQINFYKLKLKELQVIRIKSYGHNIFSIPITYSYYRIININDFIYYDINIIH